jgi:hypothetical protein
MATVACTVAHVHATEKPSAADRSMDSSVLEPMKDSGKENDQTGNNNYLHTLFDS